ncbi:ASCH domain-containing protein [Curtobacterium sp. MCLR17_051]|nr:ASCH domain-containing protein [Curtobacterium sp. MCLR17_053]PZF47278.1 ASCH domain-containing protein [Curtobacterium sp. MCLR17_051]
MHYGRGVPSTLDDFWTARRSERPSLPEAVPEAWSFGATPEQADALLQLVLDGVKVGTASSLWDYEATGDPLPATDEVSIVTAGSGAPRAVIETTAVRVVPFDQVDADHAWAEGEGDRTLEHWRTVHEAFWRAHSENPRGFAPDMPVVCERFRLLWPSS